MKLPILSRILYCLVFILGLQTCANYKLNYSNEAKGWEKKKPATDQEIRHSLFLIGDTGNANRDSSIYMFQYLKKELDNRDENNSIIFLGDNIYPIGMPPKYEADWRSLAEHKIDVQLEMLDNFKGNVTFVPGNHDWSRYGLSGLNRQEKYINKKLNLQRNGIADEDDENWEEHFYPKKGCGDPKLVEINDQLVVIYIDSEWWIRNWDSDPYINEGCDIKTRAQFYREFEEMVRKHRNKNVVIAMHHPLYSGGQHGGHYTFDNHMFPLRFINKKLYIPLPVLGSVVAFARGAVGLPQDVNNPRNREMRKAIMAALTKNGNYIVAAGHEHTLQYIERDGQQFIVSGAGSKENACGLTSGQEFGFGRLGYSRIDFYKDGSAWLHYYAMNDELDGMNEVYRKKIKEKLEISKENIPEDYPEYDLQAEKKTRKPTNFQFDKVGFMHKLFLGEHYSNLYLKEYEFDVLDLSKFKGGMTPIKRGGGNQTNSLRLADPDGREYSMRALTKDASRTLPYPINQMVGAKNILQDNFMAAHPFAALMVPDIAEAANVYHTNPHLYYVPKQPALTFNNDLYGGDVYLVEERPSEEWSDLDSFGNSDDIISTLDLVEKLQKNWNHKVDQKWVARSRLFDLLIKDWDRHEDQWRWARYEDEESDIKTYRPIPRDRDQPFAKYDGVLSWIIYAFNPFFRQLQTYTPDIDNIKWQSFNATFFDQTFLNELTWEDWEKEAIFIRDNVKDSDIELGFSKIPDNAKDEDWKQMLEYTKSRRDNIVKFARMAYELKSKMVDVVGTNDKDLFEIERIDDEQTLVEAFRLSKKGKKKESVYKRIFNHNITREVHIYGLGDDDKFVVTGDVNKSIKIRLIGGEGKDELDDSSSVRGLNKKTLFYDSSLEKTKLKVGKEFKNEIANNVTQNTYDRRSVHYNPNYWLPLPVLSFNQDDRFIVGTDISYIIQQFKKTPYGQRHNFLLTYSLGTTALNFAYTGEYTGAVKGLDLVTNTQYRRNRYAFNYFGFGNDSVNNDPENLDFNRVRQSRIYQDLMLRKTINTVLNFSFGPFIEQTQIQNTGGRFISDANEILGNSIFDDKVYSGIKTKLSFKNVDNIIDTNKGIKFSLGYDIETNLDNSDLTFRRFGVGLTVYQPIGAKENLVLASSIGYEEIRGDFDFFKAPTIGGLTNLRGFRRERFRGESVFYHATDLRLKLVKTVNNVLPFSLGIHGGFDYGRVWDDTPSSEDFHFSYGGGIYLDPVDLVVISFGQYWSKEDNRFILKFSHMF